MGTREVPACAHTLDRLNRGVPVACNVGVLQLCLNQAAGPQPGALGVPQGRRMGRQASLRKLDLRGQECVVLCLDGFALEPVFEHTTQLPILRAQKC